MSCWQKNSDCPARFEPAIIKLPSFRFLRPHPNRSTTMASTIQLLGPPELHLQPPPPPATTQDSASTLIPPTQNLTLNENEKTPILDTQMEQQPEMMGLTENLSPTFVSTGNPCLDFFFHVVPDTPREDLIKRLESAWAHNPLTALKLVCNLRGVRGTGKSDKEGFYTAALWLHKNHPKTLASNVKAIADFGYFKDWLEILYRVIWGFDVREREKSERRAKRKVRGNRFSGRRSSQRRRYWSDGEGDEHEEEEEEEEKEEVIPKKEKVVKTAEQLKEEKEKAKEEKERARVLRKEREIGKARKALDKYTLDLDYRFLHDQISNLFTELLKSDIENLNNGKLNEISLAGKWCPTVDSSYDKTTLICESIARKLYPRESYSEYQAVDEKHYVYRVRDRLRKDVLVPLHNALQLPEVFMSANQWGSLPYGRVASVAMKNYKQLFVKHDGDRFKEYLEDVKSGKVKIAAGALLPHEIIGGLEEEDGREVAELQWKRMVDDMAKKGKLSNCIAVCDVSGSMSGVPMEVSVALGVLVSELTEEPWKGKLITFSADPELQIVKGDTLLEKTEFVRQMDWGMNTNFQKVFDRILDVAVEGKLKEDQLVKKVFVFSDMEFDQASENPWETDYEAIKRKFGEKGYQSVPEIVFWNLRNSSSTPVMATQSGVALVSGFSKNLLTMFLEGGGVVNPEDVMEMAISGEEYKKLAVFD